MGTVVEVGRFHALLPLHPENQRLVQPLQSTGGFFPAEGKLRLSGLGVGVPDNAKGGIYCCSVAQSCPTL